MVWMACWSGDDGSCGHLGRSAAAVLVGLATGFRCVVFWVSALRAAARAVGIPVLVASVILGFVVDRDLGKSLLLIGFSLGVIGTISLEADISYGNIILMGSVLLIAVVVPYVVDRFVFKRHIVRFPINTGRRWTTAEKWYLIIVVGLAWVIMPFYFINSGTYLNWPAVRSPLRS